MKYLLEDIHIKLTKISENELKVEFSDIDTETTIVSLHEGESMTLHIPSVFIQHREDGTKDFIKVN